MSRTRLLRAALAAALGLVCGCSTPSGCPGSSGSSFGSRLTGLFRRDRAEEHEFGCCPGACCGEGPVIPEPAPCNGPGCASPPQSFAPPLASPPVGPPPRQVPWNEAQPMPYSPW
jgi:hypothetical protein